MSVQGFSHVGGDTLDAYHKKFPEKPTVASECCSCNAMRGQDTTVVWPQAPPNVPKISSFSGDCLKAQVGASELRPFVSGTFAWTLFDYWGESGGWPWVTSTYGAYDPAGFEKSTVYWYRAQWLAAVPEGTPGWLLSVADVLARWVPKLPVQSIDLSALSRDPSVEAAYKADPLAIQQGVRVRLAAEIRRAFQAVRDRPERFTMPLYLSHGTDDEITPPSGTTWLAEHAGSDDMTLQLWPGLLHETFHEPERDETIAHFADWLDAHAPA